MDVNKKAAILFKLSFIEFCGVSTLFYFLLYKPTVFMLNWLGNNWFSNASEQILCPGENFYAVVTGASDGIGLEYARQLAEKGYSLVLLSRTEDKLRRVAREIQEEYPQCKRVEYIVVDFTKTDIYPLIKKKLESIDGTIHVLVNNVGMFYHIPEFFTKLPEGYHLDLIHTNIVSMTAMSEIVLRIMLSQAYDRRVNPKRGVLINISSALGLTDFPMFNTYSASKAYMNHLSKILSSEHEKHGIVVQTVTPNFVKTKMIDHINDDLYMVGVRDFVKFALKTVGTEQNTSAHPWHKFLHNLALTLGGWAGEKWFTRYKFFEAGRMRQRYRKKSPMGSVYSSSKAYMNFLSKILSYELDQHKILVQTVTPHQVATNMTTDMYDPLFTVKADAFVRKALKTVETEATTSGHPWHKFHVNISLWTREILGEWLFMKLMFGYAKSALRVYRYKKYK